MTQTQRSASENFIPYTTRRRVCKACDRCRLKKNKCEGISQCSRCKADNAVCTFECVYLWIVNFAKADIYSGRKRSSDKVYPKGYAETLEQQQTQLVAGLREMYNRLAVADAWKGATLPDVNGHPLTHDILTALDLLEAKQDCRRDENLLEQSSQKSRSRSPPASSPVTQRTDSTTSLSDPGQDPVPYTCHGLQTPASSQEQIVSRSPIKAQAADHAPEGEQPFSRSLQLPLQERAQSCGDPIFFSAPWAYPESQINSFMEWEFAQLEPSNLDYGLGMSDLHASTIWGGTGNFDFNIATLDADTHNIIDAFPWVPDLQGTNAFDASQSLLDLDFSQYVSAKS
ncbi:hypothetical protein M409DRAFT_56380 [Zasmidium cellare ATCC 36951]|uniref:Zn(2)-C6 fungal-type domain-containing protein n=1 Tax=Zasmidium cellare ATCC 36951 TaxID=1080233 RepID=A0A6A6CE78_ZASCE|nr:uncharacterized protein M409DRAFT_56380 [Zasmidium cellare ATCC 36951]KAF2164540.1 hypothetical protein M409DRAFT_56380 [Zasmidium cellare ATCC 36951]